ncbi:MAG: Na/Pi cotransporter family protein [Flavobacteriales bacterium]
MQFGVFEFLRLVGALGFFIYGMKVMSEGVQKVAGGSLRRILRGMTKNRYFGVLTGFLVTALVQSSSATTVMTVSFVNAGLLTLTESVGVLMGANIGTTITAWLISLLGFKVKMAAFSLPVIAIALPLLFARQKKWNSWGEFLIGFAFLFMGLDALKDSVPDLRQNPQVLSFLASYANMGILSTLLFILVGTVLTVVVQSSSAAMALTITMCYQGWIPFEVAAPMVLGENIGTTITAQLAAVVGNVHAKRAATIHTIFNLIGVAWMILAMPFFLKAIASLMEAEGLGDPFTTATSIPFGLSYFHSAFNLVNVLLLIWFVPVLVRIAERLVKSRGDEDEDFRLEYINTGLMGTPELSMLEARKEMVKFGEITARMSGFIERLLNTDDPKKQRKMLKKLRKYEEITDRLEVELGTYLAKVSEGGLSEELSQRIRGMLSITNDLERIGDIYYQMSLAIERKNEEKQSFSPEQRQKLLELFALVDAAFEVMKDNLAADSPSGTELAMAKQAERNINSKRDELRSAHLASIEHGDYNVRGGMVYNDLFSSAERVGDHIINVSEALVGKV